MRALVTFLRPWFAPLLGLAVAVAAAVAVMAPETRLRLVEVAVARAWSDVPRIAPGRLAAALGGDEPPLLLDVRTAAEFEVSHLPGARRVDPDGGPPVDLRRDRPVVVYCSIGVRAAAYARRLRAVGFTRVANLEGAIFRWAHEGRPLVDAHGRPTTRVHPYGDWWRFLLEPEHRAARRS